jgi:hypothetical protein
MEPMTPREIAYYKAKYRFQWWWFDGGGQKAVENAVGTVCLGLFAYTAWFLAWYFEP